MMIKSLLLAAILALFPIASYAQTSFSTYLERCEDIRDDIEQILAEEGLPPYFFYLALAESGCDPKNKSDKDAMGLYQIVPRTFRVYSLGVCFPDRPCPAELAYDPIISARVAARYLKSLYDRFDQSLDWTVAAYNMGGTNLKRKSAYYKGKDIGTIRSSFPQAYNLAMKVKKFAQWGEKI